jgi:hypothetical protein
MSGSISDQRICQIRQRLMPLSGFMKNPVPRAEAGEPGDQIVLQKLVRAFPGCTGILPFVMAQAKKNLAFPDHDIFFGMKRGKDPSPALNASPQPFI